MQPGTTTNRVAMLLHELAGQTGHQYTCCFGEGVECCRERYPQGVDGAGPGREAAVSNTPNKRLRSHDTICALFTFAVDRLGGQLVTSCCCANRWREGAHAGPCSSDHTKLWALFLCSHVVDNSCVSSAQCTGVMKRLRVPVVHCGTHRPHFLCRRDACVCVRAWAAAAH